MITYFFDMIILGFINSAQWIGEGLAGQTTLSHEYLVSNVWTNNPVQHLLIPGLTGFALARHMILILREIQVEAAFIVQSMPNFLSLFRPLLGAQFFKAVMSALVCTSLKYIIAT